ncbi:MAG: ATP-grasp domain-containing protein, partial [Candidatus Dormibacteria bacterium]
VPTLEFTESKEEAKRWNAEGKTIYARKTLTGQGGAGIVVIQPRSTSFPEEHFGVYTKRFVTKREFRVHVIRDEIVKISEKKRRSNYNEPDNFVRSHNLGWVFCHNNLEPIPESIKSTAINAVRALDLDFGGVDIAMDIHGKVAVIEVNTALGLEGTTIAAYGNKFKEILNAL